MKKNIFLSIQAFTEVTGKISFYFKKAKGLPE